MDGAGAGGTAAGCCGRGAGVSGCWGDFCSFCLNHLETSSAKVTESRGDNRERSPRRWEGGETIEQRCGRGNFAVGMVSKNVMKLLFHLARSLLYVLLLAVVLGLALLASIQFRVWNFARHAENLWSDMRRVQVRRTALSEVEVLAGRWGRTATRSAPCTDAGCEFEIREYSLPLLPPDSDWSFLAPRVYQALGMRPAIVHATISVRAGLVSNTEYNLVVPVPPSKGEDGRLISNYLFVRVIGITHFTPSRLVYQARHPEYSVGWTSPRYAKVETRVVYTPYVSAADLDRVTKINFGCLSGLRRCRVKSDLMPEASAELAARQNLPDEPVCIPEIIKVTSRDTENAAVVRVLKVRDEGRMLDVQLVQRLKKAEFWTIGSEANLGKPDGLTPVLTGAISKVAAGSRAIILFERNLGPKEPVPILAAGCGVIPYSSDNLSLVQTGISEDVLTRIPQELEPRSPF